MSNTKNKEKINIRKYINYVLLMIAIVLVVLIACKLYNTYKDNRLSESVFTKFVGTIQYDDIENATSELATDGFILISYTRSESVRDLEINLKKSIENNNLQSNFYYLDATDLMLEDGYIESLNKKFDLEEKNEIVELPALLYYKDGKLKTIITSTKERMMSVDDFNKLLDSYEIIENK